MQANEATRIDNQPFLKVRQIGLQEVYPPQYPCDPWHVAGSHSTGFDENYKRALNIKETLPRVNFVVSVGSTGYIQWPSDKELPERGWTLDSLGRLVGILGKYRFFQRYTNNCRLVGDINRDGYFTCFSEEDLKELDSLLFSA